MPIAEPHADPSDPLRLAKPGDDLEARRARAKVEEQLFGGAETVTVGRYRIERKLGAGAMGVVYRAHDPDLARDVAVKLLNPETAPGDATETAHGRLVREARAMARVAHPNVIHVYDVGTVEQGVFIAMELVEGQDLATWLRESSPAWREILKACVAAGRGMAAAHTAGVIHRDFKPENVLVGSDGRVRVVDFGLAAPPPGTDRSRPIELDLKSSGEDDDFADDSPTGPSLTRTGTILGTPKYMAPEQYAGFPSERSDQFSFCVATFEALYGRPPFEGTTLSSYRKSVLEGRIVAPPAGSEVPLPIYDQLVKGLSSDPERRHPSLEHLLTSLERAAEDRRRRVLSSRTTLWMSGALVIGIMGVASWLTARDEKERTTPVQVPSATANPSMAVLPSRTMEPTRVPQSPGDSKRPPFHAKELSQGNAELSQDRLRQLPAREATRSVPNQRTCYYLQDKWKKLGERRRSAESKFLTFSSACYECWQDAPSYMIPSLQDGQNCGHHVACTPVHGSDMAQCSD